MQKALTYVLTFGLVLLPLAAGASIRSELSAATQAQEQYQGQDREQDQAQEAFQPYSDDQLDNLLAPIALYPDPLLAQVLVAATFGDQIDEAARWVRSYGQDGVDDQPWDVSVRAVAHYPSVLNMMDDNLDWTTAVGQAYVYQSTDVMGSIQRLRAMAEQQGNLVSTPQQQVMDEDGTISIWPASPQYIYVPVYDPAIVFFRPVYSGGIFTSFSFGPALAIGVWLNLDCDWGHRRVYYTGWQGQGWVARARPYIRVNNIYVNQRFTQVIVNRPVERREVNYRDLARYQSVHRGANFENRAPRNQIRERAPESQVPNKIIDRNLPSNQQYDQFRGRQQPMPASTPGSAPGAQPRPMPQQPREGPIPQRPSEQPRTFPQQQRPFPEQRPPTPAPVQRYPKPAAQQATPPPQRPPNAFGRGDSSFETRAASQRGQQSRQQMNQRPAPSRPAPKEEPRPHHPGVR